MKFQIIHAALLASLSGAFQGASAHFFKDSSLSARDLLDNDNSLYAREFHNDDDDVSGLSIRELAHEIAGQDFVFVDKRDLGLSKRDTCSCGSTNFILRPGTTRLVCKTCGAPMKVTTVERDEWGRPKKGGKKRTS